MPVFVFDGASQASHKRGHESQAAAQQLTSSFRHLVIAFGFNLHVVRKLFYFLDWSLNAVSGCQAPAGAEEELAALCRSHLIDIAVTDNISTFVYGAIHVIHDALVCCYMPTMNHLLIFALLENS